MLSVVVNTSLVGVVLVTDSVEVDVSTVASSDEVSANAVVLIPIVDV